MSWFDRWRTRQPADPATAAAMERWRALAAPDLGRSWRDARLVVVDVESSGLDPARDRLLAIGAVAVERGVVDLAQSFEIVLGQTESSETANILVHGIGGDAQRGGIAPDSALAAFLAFVRRDPLVAFHADFDRILLQRALRARLGLRFDPAWLDLAWLAPALCAERGEETPLDQWFSAFGIANYARHNALADAVATAQLALVLMARAEARGAGTLRELIDTAEAQHWLCRR